MRTRGANRDGNVMEADAEEEDNRTASTKAPTEYEEEDWDDFDMLGRWLEEASDLNVHFVYVDEEEEDLEAMAVNARPKPPVKNPPKYKDKDAVVDVEMVLGLLLWSKLLS